jgi:hypothetical protein
MFNDVTGGKPEPPKRFRVALVLFGIGLTQFVLYGPSLIGQKILLPLDLLAGPAIYIPRTPDIIAIREGDGSVADLVFLFEPTRRFAVSEFHAGHLPMWAPYHYAGAPFIWPKFSPFLALQCATRSPVLLAWSQLLAALIAGLGAYLFFRVVLAVGFWPAAICAWCYPLTGFFVLWQGFYTALPVCWLPWLLLAVDCTLRCDRWLAPLGVALVTCLVVLSGALDVAGQVMMASGLYALGRLVELVIDVRSQDPLAPERGPTSDSFGQFLPCRKTALRRAARAITSLAAGWAVGLMLAMPHLLPVLEYTHTGARMARRAAGDEERPPIGLAALPQLVLPDMYGITRQPGLRYAGGLPQQESSAAGYAGLLMTLLAAPLAFCSRRHRASNLLWVVLLLLSLSWCLNIPGLVNVLRLPGLNMMSHNRLVFVAGFAFLALATTGLETLLQEPSCWRRWMWLPLALLASLCAWSVYRSFHLPEPIATRLGLGVSRGAAVSWVHGFEGVQRVQAWFVQYYASAAVWCGIGVLGWICVRSGRLQQPKLVPVLAVFVVGELFWFGYGRNVQSDPALYYPRIPVLQSLAQAPPGRVMGFGCLPAPLAAVSGLRDIRGYDAVDPPRLVELIMGAADPDSTKPGYAPTMEIAPKATITPNGDIQLLPVLDMLGVRYVIFRGEPFPTTHPIFKGEDYWVLQNPRALSRAFVPERVEVITNDTLRVQKIESTNFNPRAVAYVESPVPLTAACRGTAEITHEIPTRIEISARMETPGLVVLADLWDKGWHAYLEGKSVPILRANHAVRGVVVPAGSHKLEFRYEPASFVLGLELAGISAVILLVWLGINSWRARPG